MLLSSDNVFLFLLYLLLFFFFLSSLDPFKMFSFSSILHRGASTALQRVCWICLVKVLVFHLYSTLCNPMDHSLPGSSVHGILQTRILEWPFPSPGDLPDTRIEPKFPALQADSLLFKPPGKPWWVFAIWNLHILVPNNSSLLLSNGALSSAFWFLFNPFYLFKHVLEICIISQCLFFSLFSISAFFIFLGDLLNFLFIYWYIFVFF